MSAITAPRARSRASAIALHVLAAAAAVLCSLVLPRDATAQETAAATAQETPGRAVTQGCLPKFASVPAVVDLRSPDGRGYDPFRRVTHFETLSIAVVGTAGAVGCSAVLTVTTPDDGEPDLAGAAYRLPLEVLDGPSGRSVVSRGFGPASESVGVLLADRGARALDLLLSVPALRLAKAGVYTGELVLRLFDGADAFARPTDQRVVRVRTKVETRLGISFTDDLENPAATSSIDFGTLRAGDRRSVPLYMRSTAAFDLLVSSENGGALANTLKGAEGVTVPYLLFVDGAQVALGRAPALARSYPDTVSTGPLRIDATVEIGNSRGLAGRYRDTVTFTIIARE